MKKPKQIYKGLLNNPSFLKNLKDLAGPEGMSVSISFNTDDGKKTIELDEKFKSNVQKRIDLLKKKK